MRPRPPWLAPTRNAPIPSEALDELCERLDAGGSCWIEGEPGNRRLQLLAAIATRTDRSLVAVRLSGCRNKRDIVLALSWSLQTRTHGSMAVVIERAKRIERPLFLIDEAELPALDELVDDLRMALPDASWACAANRPAPPTMGSHIQKLDSDPPTEFPTGFDLSAGTPGTIHPALLLAGAPAGLPRLGPLPESILLVNTNDRQVLQPATVELLRSRLPSPSQIASALRKVYSRALELSYGAPILQSHRWEDALTIRWMGEVLADPDQACEASATAAKMFVAWGQLEEAGRVIESAKRRNAQAQERAQALLTWADADRHLAIGDLRKANVQFDATTQYLRDSGEDRLLAQLHLHRADRQFQRGNTTKGAKLLRTARRMLTALNDRTGLAAAVRCAADMAVASGELLSAETLYDQSISNDATPSQSAARRIGLAGLALSQGDHRRATVLLDESELNHDSQVLLGNRLRRVAELSLKEGDFEFARNHAGRALVAYGRAGVPVAVGHTLRLQGDIACCQGFVTEAWDLYWEAVDVHIQTHDDAGLLRTIRRLSLLESAAGRRERADQLVKALAEIRKERSI